MHNKMPCITSETTTTILKKKKGMNHVFSNTPIR